MNDPKGAPAPAPRPSAPQPRTTQPPGKPPGPKRIEAVCYLVGGIALGELLKSSGPVDAGSLIHALNNRLHVRPVDALLKAAGNLKQKAYEIRVTVEVLGEVNAAVVPHEGETA